MPPFARISTGSQGKARLQTGHSINGCCEPPAHFGQFGKTGRVSDSNRPPSRLASVQLIAALRTPQTRTLEQLPVDSVSMTFLPLASIIPLCRPSPCGEMWEKRRGKIRMWLSNSPHI